MLFRSGHLGQLDSRIPFFMAGSLSLVTGLAGLLLLPESLPTGRRSGSVGLSINPFRSIGELRRLRGFGPLVPAFGILTMAQNVMTTSWVPYATARFDWGPRQNGWGLFFYGAIAAAAQGLLFPWLVRRIEVQRICRVAMISTHNTFQARGAFRDVARAYGVAPDTVDRWCRSIPRYTEEPLAEAVAKSPRGDRKSTRLNSSHIPLSRMPSSA